MGVDSVQQWNWDVWRSDEDVGLLSPAARCVWHEVLGVMWKSGQTGELSGSYRDLAKLCRVTETEARAAIKEIKARKVADVTESQTPDVTSGHSVVTLINRRMQRESAERSIEAERLEKKRKNAAFRQFKSRTNRALQREGKPIIDDVTLLSHFERQACHTVTTQEPPPPSSFSFPTPLSLTPPTSPVPTAAQSGGVDPPQPEEKTGGSRRRAERKPGADRVLTDEQQACRVAFQSWWIEVGYPQSHGGVVYDFACDGSRNGAAVLKILRNPNVAWNLDTAKRLAETFFKEPDMYLARGGHTLYDLAQRIGWFLSKMKGVRHVVTSNSNSNGSNGGQFIAARGSAPRLGPRNATLTGGS
jgi:hypothetical protein